MKSIFTLLFSLLCLLTIAQTDKLPGIDKSPLDLVYFPEGTSFRNFQKGADRDVSPIVRLLYSRPQKKGRVIFGDLVPYDEVWRLGANEATELTLYQDAKIGNVNVKAGSYTLFARIHEDKWTILISTDLYVWGHYHLDESKIIGQIEVPTAKTSSEVDAFTAVFRPAEGGTNLLFLWDNTQVSIPIRF